MGIAVRINALQDALSAAPDIHEISQNQITIGSYNDDTIKLEHRKLQGKHIRIHSEWNRNSGQTRLVVTNISGSNRLLVGNRLLNEDETQVLDENMRIQMGDYRLTATIHNPDIQAILNTQLEESTSTAETGESEKPFTLDSFTPDDLAIDNAVQSLLQTATNEQFAIKPEVEKEIPENNLNASDALTSEIEDKRQSSEEVEAEAITVSDPVGYPESSPTSDITIETQAIVKEGPQTTDLESIADKEAVASSNSNPSDLLREIPDNIVPIQKEADSGTDTKPRSASNAYGAVEQTLFEHIAGLNDIQEMDFDALRLLTISGQVTHHSEAMAGIEIEGGELGVIHTDQNGRFCFDNVIEGTHYQINVKHDGYLLSGKGILSGILGHDIIADLKATRLTRVTGRLTHAGKPLSGIQLDAGEFGTCTSDSEGNYSFEDIPEGAKLAISASRSGYCFKRKSAVSTTNNHVQSAPKSVKAKKPSATSTLSSINRDNGISAKKPSQDDEFAASLAILTGKNQALAS